VRVFVSSPGDLAVERVVVASVADGLQRLPSMSRRFAIQSLLWERDVPPILGGPAQLAVDRYMAEPGDVELFIVLMGSRLGSPFTHPETGIPYPSGTEYELDKAYQSFKRSQRPLILVYHCLPPAGAPVDGSEAARLEAFFDSFSRRYDGIQPKPIRDRSTLQDVLYRDLGSLIESLDDSEKARRDEERRIRRRRLCAATASIALLMGGIAFAYHRGQVERRAHELERAARTIVDRALVDDDGRFEAEPIWARVTDQLVAIGPPAVGPIVDALARPEVYDRPNRVDQTPTVALVRALARDAGNGALDRVCSGFWSVLKLRPDGARFPKGTHRIVIREGLARTSCPGRSEALCSYLGGLSSTVFTDHPDDWVDLRDAAALLLRPDRAAACMESRG
jgi:hypothetical protein